MRRYERSAPDLRHPAPSFTVGLICCVLLIVIAPGLRAQTPSDYETQRKEALALFSENRLIEALPLFQHLDEINPKDAVVKEHLAFTLIALAASKTDPQERIEIRLRARKLFLDAQALGDNSNLLRVGLDEIPADGSIPAFSDRKDVEDAMREGETAYGKADFDSAIAAYQRALLLDPKQYEAALFIGDVHFKMKEMDKAGDWFGRAIAIDPDRETAYRYWGDALAQSHKNSEAVDKYINAIVAEPYKRESWVGLIQFAQSLKVTLTQPHIVSPDSFKADGKNTTITIDPSLSSKNGASGGWMAYEMSRALWHGDKFKKEFPEETEYRHSLREEAESLNAAAEVVTELQKDQKPDTLDPAFVTLLKLKQEGLIEAYVLISAPDEGIAKDYPAYRDTHRDLLDRYIAEYIANPLASKF